MGIETVIAAVAATAAVAGAGAGIWGVAANGGGKPMLTAPTPKLTPLKPAPKPLVFKKPTVEAPKKELGSDAENKPPGYFANIETSPQGILTPPSTARGKLLS